MTEKNVPLRSGTRRLNTIYMVAGLILMPGSGPYL